MTDWLNEIGWIDWLAGYALVLMRVLGLFFFLPILGSEVISIRIRLAIAAVLAFALLPLVPLPPVAGLNLMALFGLTINELAVGFALGLSAKIVFTAVEAAAAIVAGQSGFSIASMVDPHSGDPSIIPATFTSLLFITLFVTANLHHLFIRTVLASYEILPISSPLVSFGMLGSLGGTLGARLFGIAITLAAPALILSIAVDLILVLVGKAMPQVPILMVAYPFKMAAGLVSIILLSVSVGNALGWIGRTLVRDSSTLLHALASP